MQSLLCAKFEAMLLVLVGLTESRQAGEIRIDKIQNLLYVDEFLLTKCTYVYIYIRTYVCTYS